MDETAEMAGSNLEFADQTVLHPLGLLMVVVLGVVTLAVPRRHAALPMIILACLVAPAQRLVVLTLDFNLLRILVLVGWIRVLARGEVRRIAWRPLDTALVLWAFSSVLTYTVLYATSAAFINRLGVCFDAFGMYFFFRCVVRTWQDVDHLVKGFIILSVPVAGAFLVEHFSGRNPFAFFGGVPTITPIREGRLRCQGPFSHAILAGCFWASLVPLFVAHDWVAKRGRAWAIVGVSASTLVVLLTASSTPLMALIACVVGACFFPLRRQMAVVRWTCLFVLVGLHLVMKAPVWHLVSRIGLVSGSTAWHRFHLMDQAIRRFGEWWLCGTQSTAHWGHGLTDVTNQYILEGVRGGALTLLFFIGIIALGFRSVGHLWRASGGDRRREIGAWALGVSLFVHCVNYLGVTYFGNAIVAWYLLLAAIGSLDRGWSPVRRRRRVRSRRPVPKGAAHPSVVACRRAVPQEHSGPEARGKTTPISRLCLTEGPTIDYDEH